MNPNTNISKLNNIKADKFFITNAYLKSSHSLITKIQKKLPHESHFFSFFSYIKISTESAKTPCLLAYSKKPIIFLPFKHSALQKIYKSIKLSKN